MATTSTINLSQLPFPPVVETLDYEAIRADNLSEAQALLGDTYDLTDVADPAVIVLEALSYREMIWRQRVNEAAKAVMIAYAGEGDLENLGALMGVKRLNITPADATTGAAAVMENIELYRRRILLAPQGYSVAGPEGAYLFHALSASSDVRDASVDAPRPDDIKTAVIDLLTQHSVAAPVIAAMQAMLDAANWPGTVITTILSHTGDGIAPQATLDAVSARLSSDTVRPLTDHVLVQSAQLLPFDVDATLYFFDGPDRSTALSTARTQLNTYVTESLLLGRDITRMAIGKALMATGVQNVDLRSPPADVVCSDVQAGHCTGITLLDGGVRE